MSSRLTKNQVAPGKKSDKKTDKELKALNKKLSKKQNRKLRWFRNILIAANCLLVVAIIAFLMFFTYLSSDLPAPNNIVRSTGFTTRIYDRNHNLLFEMHGDERREHVRLEDASPHFINATIAVEDRDFWEHGGFDILTIFRIPYYWLFHGRLIGGSTLTQQLVKNVFLTNERTVLRKAREIILAMQIESQFTKEQILEMYINETPYGGNIWSAGIAAQTFFNKDLIDLTVAESAVLAGLPQSPHRYNPFAGRTNDAGEFWWRHRAMGVLRRMREDGHINDFQFSEAMSDLQEMTFERQITDINAPHFVFFVEQQLIDMFGEDVLQDGGLQVITSLDLGIHNAVQQIVAEEVAAVEHFNISNGAATVIDPRTGEIIAMVGSRDFFNSEMGGQFDVVTQALRQPGSAIKPLVYLAYMMQGGRETTLFADVPTDFRANELLPSYTPRNFDGRFRGPITLRDSLGNSYNIPAVKALANVGLDNFLTLAHDAGFTTLAPTPENLQNLGLSLALGGGEVRMIDMGIAFSAFANGGRRVEPVSILEVRDHRDRTIYRAAPVQGRQVFGEGEAFIINHIMADNDARSAAFGANSLLNTDLPIAVKTGTTNMMRDNWAVGWSQNFLVNVWVGNNDNTPMAHVASGLTGASPIWRRVTDYMMLSGWGAPEWEMPSNVTRDRVDRVSGWPAHSDFETRYAFHVRGTLPSLPDPIHQRVRLCRGQFRLATPAQIAVGDYEERVIVNLVEHDPVSQDGRNRWQEGINDWINAHGGDRFRMPTEYCGDLDEVLVRIHGLDNERSYDSHRIRFRVEADSGEGIDRIEIFVDDQLRHSVNGRSGDVELDLPRGRYRIHAVAVSRSGRLARTSVFRIGTDGAHWREEPTPSPSPTPTPSPNPGANGSSSQDDVDELL
ncbi:MAG: transglycosylase domain-containing protein [Pseudomonadales bacterium]|jgi:penicillin-binding protein 1C|nr:transglycosylase domain-containing protein [Pseudomonadales bacterium]